MGLDPRNRFGFLQCCLDLRQGLLLLLCAILAPAIALVAALILPTLVLATLILVLAPALALRRARALARTTWQIWDIAGQAGVRNAEVLLVQPRRRRLT